MCVNSEQWIDWLLKNEWFMPQLDTAPFFPPVKVEEVIGNVLRTFCDYCAEIVFCGLQVEVI